MSMDTGLSISGGGILGVGPAHFLARLEKDLGKKSLYDTFAAFAGTSTGAICAGALAEKVTAENLEKLYKDNGKKIFKSWNRFSPMSHLLVKNAPKYDNSELKVILQDILKGCFAEWKKEVFIPAFDMLSVSNPEKVFDRGDKDIPKWFGILASTSAPTYFMPAGSDENWIDGGMFANSPVEILQAGYKKRTGKGEGKFKILSLETGMTLNVAGEGGNKSLLGWGEYILSDFVARSEKSETYKAKANLGEENVFVVSPVVTKKYQMDKLENIDEIIKIWDKEYDKVKDDLLKWLKR